MIKITNGSRTTIVTMGAYKEMYAPMGWKIADSEQEKASVNNLPEVKEEPSEIANEEPETDVEESDQVEEVEIPLSEMKLDQLKQYAADHDIDISAARNKQDIRDIIKAEMEA